VGQPLRDPLAFGDHRAKELPAINDAQDEAARLLPGLIRWDFFNRSDFQFKTSTANVNGLPLAAISTPATRIQFGLRPEPALVFPWTGQTKFTAEKHLIAMQANTSAVFVPTGYRSESKGESRSVAVARINPQRLESTLSTMLGLREEGAATAALSKTSEVSLAYGKVSFDTVFRALFCAVDAYADNPHMLAASGIDDVFYRTLAMAMHPEAFERQARLRAASADRRKLDRVCQYIQAHFSKPITLTTLEQVGHMSRRTLHNAFMKVFGLSPMAWVREQRMLAVRAMLQKHSSVHTVSQALYSCGFTNPSLFATQYKTRFGELPSVTRERGQTPMP
jgi:AraC-like DNA-binding protein